MRNATWRSSSEYCIVGLSTPGGLDFQGIISTFAMIRKAVISTKSRILQNVPGTPHEAPEGPKFTGDFSTTETPAGEQLTVVSYNIQYGKKIDEAIVAFREFDRMRIAEVILLQEMDEHGVESIARELKYNYLYYPATMNRKGRNFGNAILSRLPLKNHKKIILPYKHPVNRQLRIAVRATVEISGQEVLIYSVHTETYTVSVSHRWAQVNAIVQDIGESSSPVIVGGDFNTVFGRSIRRMVGQFDQVALAYNTSGIGATIGFRGLKPMVMDHIFTRGFTCLEAGVIEGAGASDHFPVWVELKLDRD